MKKILALILTLFLLPLISFAQGNKPLTKWQQNLQKRNKQTLQHLQILGQAYQNADNMETKDNISRQIEMEINFWYMENIQTINQAKQEEARQAGKEVKDIFSEEYANKIKQELAAEVKTGKIPEIIQQSIPGQKATQLNRFAEIRAKIDKEKANTPKQKSTGFNLFNKNK